MGTVPLIVECYEHAEFSGRNITVLRDVPHTGALGLHDSISSVRIIKGSDFPPQGAEVTFFEHVDFEGSKLTIRMDAKDHKKEIPNFHYLPQQFNDVVSSIKIEGWSTSAEFTEMVFEDEFIGNRMRPEWRWEDPEGGGHWAERQGYLEMRAEPGQDLWHGDPNQPVPRDHNLPPDAVVLRAAGAIQMESGVTIIDKDGATGRKAIDSQRGARAFHNVYLRRPGRWYIWIRGYFPEPSKDSYWIGKVEQVRLKSLQRLETLLSKVMPFGELGIGIAELKVLLFRNPILKLSLQAHTVYGQKGENRVQS